MKQKFSISEASTVTQIPAEIILRWVSKNVITPEFREASRFSFNDLLKMAVLDELMDEGFRRNRAAEIVNDEGQWSKIMRSRITDVTRRSKTVTIRIYMPPLKAGLEINAKALGAPVRSG